MAGVILAITVLATGSVVPYATAGFGNATITGWTVTLTNTISGKSIVWTQAGTGLPDCDDVGTACFIDLTPGQLRKCFNASTLGEPLIVLAPFLTSTPPPALQCKGPWEVSISGVFTCPVIGCQAILGPF
jgi:hypothetical protein